MTIERVDLREIYEIRQALEAHGLPVATIGRDKMRVARFLSILPEILRRARLQSKVSCRLTNLLKLSALGSLQEYSTPPTIYFASSEDSLRQIVDNALENIDIKRPDAIRILLDLPLKYQAKFVSLLDILLVDYLQFLCSQVSRDRLIDSDRGDTGQLLTNNADEFDIVANILTNKGLRERIAKGKGAFKNLSEDDRRHIFVTLGLFIEEAFD